MRVTVNSDSKQWDCYRGKGIAKFLGGLLFVAAAGAAAVYFKQEFDKKPRTQHEILVVDDHIGESIKHPE